MIRKIYVVFGILFLAAGIAGLVHPEYSYRTQQRTMQMGNLKEIIETRRMVRIPRWSAALFVVLGAGIAVTGWKGI